MWIITPCVCSIFYCIFYLLMLCITPLNLSLEFRNTQYVYYHLPFFIPCDSSCVCSIFYGNFLCSWCLLPLLLTCRSHFGTLCTYYIIHFFNFCDPSCVCSMLCSIFYTFMPSITPLNLLVEFHRTLYIWLPFFNPCDSSCVLNSCMIEMSSNIFHFFQTIIIRIKKTPESAVKF